ncbi:MAG: hypothetical protein J6Z12_06760 [Paludibacteraceae bacterium]|nr:hypothetical protein [Paludibacteraceae bacterium]
MKKRMLRLLGICLAAFVLSSCNRGDETFEVVYNPYVEAFTQGVQPKNAEITVLLSQPVPEELTVNGKWEKYVSLSPKAKGVWSLSPDRRCLTFSPTEPFKSGKQYSVELKTAKLLGVEPEDKRHGKFRFAFRIQEWAASAFFLPISIDENDENRYNISCLVVTAQAEDSLEVERCGKFSESANIRWTHSLDGKRHTALLTGIEAGSQPRDLSYTYRTDARGGKETVTLRIPAVDEFTVLQASYEQTPSRCIEVTFSKPLATDQELTGMVFIGGSGNTTYEMSGNRVRLFPDQETKGRVSVEVQAGIRSRSGLTLQQNTTLQVHVGGDQPGLAFLSQGNIVPSGEKVTIPFQASWLRGVVVRVVEIKENRIWQFLQINHLDGNDELMRTGRLVAHELFFFDQSQTDLHSTQTFALDISRLVRMEPGSLYRIFLSANRDFSLYPGANEKLPDETALKSEFDLKFRREERAFDEGGWYYYIDDNKGTYNWREREDPTKDAFYENMKASLTVTATSIGVTALQGADRTIHVLTHDLNTAQPRSKVKITLYNYQGDEVGNGTTDADGKVSVTYGASRPFYLAASQDKERSYLRIDHGSSLSTSNFDVSGVELQEGTRGFLYGERGVWRPGDTLHLGFMLYDKLGTLPASHPVTIELSTPLGQLYTRKTTTLGQHHLCCFAIPLDPDAPTGAWQAVVRAGDATYSKTLRVETIKPNRLSIRLTPDGKRLDRGGANPSSLHAEWLTGSKAHGLKYDIQARFTTAQTHFNNYAGYVFQDPARAFEPQESSLLEGQLDQQGNARPALTFKAGSQAPGMLNAQLTVKVYEESGEFSTVSQKVPFSPYNTYIGIRSPQQDKAALHTGKQPHRFQVVSVDADGQPKANVNCRVRLFHTYWYWWWSSSAADLAEYVGSGYNDPISTQTVKTDAQGKASVQFVIDNDNWGTYYIQVQDIQGGHSTGTLAYFDWPNAGDRRFSPSDAATFLPLTLSKDTAQVGNSVQVNFTAAVGSRAVVSVENSAKVLSIQEYEVTQTHMSIPVEVTADMQPNAYIHVMLLQPYSRSLNDCPIRLYGIVPLTVNDAGSRLHPVIGMKDELQPEQSYTIQVRERNGRPMSYSLAIVDEGLLSLTAFRTPDPWQAFHAREALGVRTWDLYNSVLGAYGGRISQLFSIGGDGELDLGSKSLVNRFTPVVVFKGPFTLEQGKTRTHKLTMPNYNGKVRVMVVATDGTAFGSEEKSVPVRSDVQILCTLPRRLGCGEEFALPATVFANKNGIGTIELTLECGDGLETIGETKQKVTLTQTGDKTVPFLVKSSGRPGSTRIRMRAAYPGGSTTYETELEIEDKTPVLTHWKSTSIEKGGNWTYVPENFGTAGSKGMSVEISGIPSIHLGSRLKGLVNYPHACVEQTASKGMGLLVRPQMEPLSDEEAQTVSQTVEHLINHLRNYQTPSGGLAYWPGNSTPDEWGSAYGLDFLQQAAKIGYRIPEGLKNALTAYIKTTASRWQADEKNPWYRKSQETIQAYRLWVLAADNQADQGAMNRLKSVETLNDEARWLLAGAYAACGRDDAAGELLGLEEHNDAYTAGYDLTYGSDIRLNAFKALTLIRLKRYGEAATYITAISQDLASDNWISTQSTAAAYNAVNAYWQAAGRPAPISFSINCNGQEHVLKNQEGIYEQTLSDGDESLKKLTVKNLSDQVIFAQVEESGRPKSTDTQAYANGINLAVSYTHEGKSVSIAQLRQGSNFTANITLQNQTALPVRNLVVEQVMPSGWEILNNRFNEENASTSGLSYQDIRDNRIYSYIDELGAGASVSFSVKLCATYAGTFYLPPVTAGAMYDNALRAHTASGRIKVE